jgi:hypothetical protein
MKAPTIPAPPIRTMEVLPNNILKLSFKGEANTRYVDLNTFPLLGVAKELIKNPELLNSFKLVDGIPEWNGQCLLGPDDLFEHSVTSLPIAGSYSKRIESHYKQN